VLDLLLNHNLQHSTVCWSSRQDQTRYKTLKKEN